MEGLCSTATCVCVYFPMYLTKSCRLNFSVHWATMCPCILVRSKLCKRIKKTHSSEPQLDETLKTRHAHGSKTNGRFGKKRLKHVGVLRLKSRLRRLLLTPTLLTHSWAHTGSEFCFYLLFWDGQLPAVCWPSWPSTEQPSSTYMCCGTSSGPSLICQTSNKPHVRMFCNNIRVFLNAFLL